MGRKLVEATKASRMRRTRGETGRLRFFALAACVCPVAVFLPATVWPGFAAAELDFDGADLRAAGAAGAVCSAAGFFCADPDCPAAACLSGAVHEVEETEVEETEDG
jgi:hypothetical protein